jgi:hypothetical protein
MAGEAGAAWGGGERPVVAVPTLFSTGREKKAGWAGWAKKAGKAAKPTRPKSKKKNLFRIKIGFLNLPRFWKFVQGDLCGILMLGFFLNSSRLLMDF